MFHVIRRLPHPSGHCIVYLGNKGMYIHYMYHAIIQQRVPIGQWVCEGLGTEVVGGVAGLPSRMGSKCRVVQIVQIARIVCCLQQCPGLRNAVHTMYVLRT